MLATVVIGFLCLVVFCCAALLVTFVLKLIRRILDR